MSPEIGTVWQLLNLGWSVQYSVASITFSCHQRSVRVHDSGHVEMFDVRDRLSAPSRQDQIWESALDLLEIDLARLEFNPFLRHWSYPLGNGHDRAHPDERVRSAQ